MQNRTQFDLNNHHTVSFFGPNDENLRFLETRFDIKLFISDSKVEFQADHVNTRIIQEILEEMLDIVSHKGFVKLEDVKTLVRLNSGTGTAGNNAESDTLLGEFQGIGRVYANNALQKTVLRDIDYNDIKFLIGPAGTGKTFFAVAIAVRFLQASRVQRIILARPAVEAGESLGYLPGDFRDKIAPYLRPLYDNLTDLLSRDKLRRLIDEETIEVIPLAYMRGRTINNAFIILDEAQNANTMQMKMFLTRIGKNSKAIITGDVTQIDLNDRAMSGLASIPQILDGIEGIGFYYANKGDVVRHRLVKEIIAAYERLNDKEKK